MKIIFVCGSCRNSFTTEIEARNYAHLHEIPCPRCGEDMYYAIGGRDEE